jgi:CheY-like chemotaxis protein
VHVVRTMKKALVIEDHPDSLDVLSWQLEMLGFAVASANNGREGVEKAAKEKPDLILMDIMMPGMDGREATRRIRNNPDTKNTLIMATTVLYKGSDLTSCMEAGCNDFILKPFTFEELREKIQEYFPP